MRPTESHVAAECARVFAAIPLLNALDKTGKREVVAALVRNCQSDEHVDTVLRTFQETILEWRNPIAELVQIARQTARPNAPPDGCERCEDPAWQFQPDRPRWLKHVQVFDEAGEFVRADFCSCRRGDWYREVGR